MDRLPKHNELVFERLRKTLYLRLTTVIRSLSTKFDVLHNELVRKQIEFLCSSMVEPFRKSRSGSPLTVYCILAEICQVRWEYLQFISGKSGDRRRTKKLEAGIARLEWLRDNWDDLEVTGDLKRGYELEIKK